jgi:glycerol-3-phosphate acyltransferase PlsY
MSWIDQLHGVNWTHATVLAVFGYLLGCFTSGYYLVRWLAEKDIREIGSGNVGARNVGRVLGKKGFFLTVAFDTFKGVLAVLIARKFSADERVVLLTMTAVVIGHVWPIQLSFRGGKGMATSVGSLLIFDPVLATTFAISFLCLAGLMRRTVLPGLFAIACVPLADFWLSHNPTRATLLSLWAGLVLLAHRKNLFEEFAQIAARRHPQSHPEQHHL